MATYSSSLKRFSTGPLHGIALALYFVLLPYAVVSKWNQTSYHTNATLVRGLLLALGIFWLTFVVQFVRNIVRLRRGIRVGVNGSAWLAGLVVALLPFLVSASSSGANTLTRSSVSTNISSAPWITTPVPIARHRHGQDPTPITIVGALPFALIAKRRFDHIQQGDVDVAQVNVDSVIEELRAYDPSIIAKLRTLIGDRISGVIDVPDELSAVAESTQTTPSSSWS